MRLPPSKRIEEPRVMLEMLTGVERHGADIIITYTHRRSLHAAEVLARPASKPPPPQGSTYNRRMRRPSSKTPKSAKLFARAQKILPGGVDSPVRAFKAVNRDPLFIRRATGSRIQDVDGHTYIDYVMSWGPLIHGHAPRGLTRPAQAARDGTSFGAPSELEVRLGEHVRRLMPSLDRVRFVNSGTEAAMSAVRVARAATGRDKIIKFEGCYHGHADPFLVKAGSGLMTFGVPTSPGVPRAAVADTLACDIQRSKRVRASLTKHIAGRSPPSSSNQSPETWASSRLPRIVCRAPRPG